MAARRRPPVHCPRSHSLGPVLCCTEFSPESQDSGPDLLGSEAPRGVAESIWLPEALPPPSSGEQPLLVWALWEEAGCQQPPGAREWDGHSPRASEASS